MSATGAGSKSLGNESIQELPTLFTEKSTTYISKDEAEVQKMIIFNKK